MSLEKLHTFVYYTDYCYEQFQKFAETVLLNVNNNENK